MFGTLSKIFVFIHILQEVASYCFKPKIAPIIDYCYLKYLNDNEYVGIGFNGNIAHRLKSSYLTPISTRVPELAFTAPNNACYTGVEFSPTETFLVGENAFEWVIHDPVSHKIVSTLGAAMPGAGALSWFNLVAITTDKTKVAVIRTTSVFIFDTATKTFNPTPVLGPGSTLPLDVIAICSNQNPTEIFVLRKHALDSATLTRFDLVTNFPVDIIAFDPAWVPLFTGEQYGCAHYNPTTDIIAFSFSKTHIGLCTLNVLGCSVIDLAPHDAEATAYAIYHYYGALGSRIITLGANLVFIWNFDHTTRTITGLGAKIFTLHGTYGKFIQMSVPEKLLIYGKSGSFDLDLNTNAIYRYGYSAPNGTAVASSSSNTVTFMTLHDYYFKYDYLNVNWQILNEAGNLAQSNADRLFSNNQDGSWIMMDPSQTSLHARMNGVNYNYVPWGACGFSAVLRYSINTAYSGTIAFVTGYTDVFLPTAGYQHSVGYLDMSSHACTTENADLKPTGEIADYWFFLFKASDNNEYRVLMNSEKIGSTYELYMYIWTSGSTFAGGENITFTSNKDITVTGQVYYFKSVDMFYIRGGRHIYKIDLSAPMSEKIDIAKTLNYVPYSSCEAKLTNNQTEIYIGSLSLIQKYNAALNTITIISNSLYSGFVLVPFANSTATTDIQILTNDGGVVDIYKDDFRCLDCDISCNTCYGTGPAECLTCKTGYQLNSTTGKCQIICAANEYIENNTCFTCHISCGTCVGPLQSDCSSCTAADITLIGGTCIKNCQASEYFNSTLLDCYPCHPRCAKCTGMTDHECTSCYSGFKLDSTSFCLRLCGNGQYLDVALDTCKPCHPSCDTCFEGTHRNCTACLSNWTLISSQSYCKPKCPRGQYASEDLCLNCTSPCLECTSVSYCTVCLPNFINKGSGVCECPISGGYYIDLIKGECLLCNDVCKTCSNNSINGCLTCTEGYLYNPFALANEPNCVQSCPSTSYGDTGSGYCTSCHADCASCYDGTNTSCTSCKEGFGLFTQESACYTVCPEGFALVESKRLCSPCDPFCLKCNPLELTQCYNCSSGFYVYKGTCAVKCPSRTYPTTKDYTKICQSCSEGCEICNEAGNCTKCFAGYLHGPKCVSSCPVGYKISAEQADPTKKFCEKIFCQTDCDLCKDSEECLICKNTSATGLPIILALGLCVTCEQSSGLVLKEGVCSEICGDGILYKLNATGLSVHECDDGNSNAGDGCTSDCMIENKYTCVREFSLIKSNYQTSDMCDLATTKILERDSDNPQRFSYTLKFSRSVFLTVDEFKQMFNLIIVDDAKNEFIMPQDVIVQDLKTLYITINEKQFTGNVNGNLLIKKKRDYTKPALFKDEALFDVDINGMTAPFIYDKSKEGRVQSIVKLTDSINGFMESGGGQTVLVVASMNPVFFNMMVNVLQKFVYFRVINIPYPDTVQFFFKVFGAAWSVNPGQTDYDPKAKPNAFDAAMGLDKSDQDIPDRFKLVKLSSLFIKTSLPSLLILLVTYSMAIGTLIIEKKAKTYSIKRLQKKKMMALVFKVNGILKEKLVWSAIIQSNFMSYQNFTFGIFLNLTMMSRTKYITMFSSVLAIFGIIFVLANIIFYIFLIKSEKKEGGGFDKKFEIFNGSRDNVIAQNYKVFKYLMKPSLLALIMCFFYFKPIVPVYSLFIVSLIEQLVICIKPIYKDKKDNFRIIFEGFFMTFLSLFPMIFYYTDPKSEKHATWGLVMIGIVIFLLLANLIMGVIFTKKTL